MTPHPGNLIYSSDLCGHQAYIWPNTYMYTFRQNMHIYKLKMSLKMSTDIRHLIGIIKIVGVVKTISWKMIYICPEILIWFFKKICIFLFEVSQYFPFAFSFPHFDSFQHVVRGSQPVLAKCSITELYTSVRKPFETWMFQTNFRNKTSPVKPQYLPTIRLLLKRRFGGCQ